MVTYFFTLNIRTLYNNYVKVLFLAAKNLNLIKIPICWIIPNFYSIKLEQYLIGGTVHLKKKQLSNYVKKSSI